MFVYYWLHVDSCFSFKKGEDEDRLSMLTDNVFTVRLVRVGFTPLFLALYSVKQLILELLRI